jgi:hypothetical protein
MKLKLYYSVGGILMTTSALAFAYTILFNYKATFAQYSAGIFILAAGALFMGIAGDMKND